MRRLSKWQIISLTVSVAIIAFIFINSAQPAEESSSMSGGLLSQLYDFFALFGIELTLSHNGLRKIAHFVEFFAVGISFFLTMRSFTKDIKRHIVKPALAALIVAAIDETIQLFPPGRSSQVSDVVLDFTGAFCGIMITWFIVSKINKKRSQS